MRALTAARPNVPSEIEPLIIRAPHGVSVWETDDSHLEYSYENNPDNAPFKLRDIFRAHRAIRGRNARIPSEAPGVLLGLPTKNMVELHRVAAVDVPLAKDAILGALGYTAFERHYVLLSQAEVHSILDDDFYPDIVIAKAVHAAIHGEPDTQALDVAVPLLDQTQAAPRQAPR